MKNLSRRHFLAQVMTTCSAPTAMNFGRVAQALGDPSMQPNGIIWGGHSTSPEDGRRFPAMIAMFNQNFGREIQVPLPFDYVHSLRAKKVEKGWVIIALSKAAREVAVMHLTLEGETSTIQLAAPPGSTICGHGDFLKNDELFCYAENVGIDGRSHLIVARLSDGKILHRLDLEMNDAHEIRCSPWHPDQILIATSNPQGTYLTEVDWRKQTVTRHIDSGRSDIMLRHFDVDPLSQSVVVSGKWREHVYARMIEIPNQLIVPVTLMFGREGGMPREITVPGPLQPDFDRSVQLLSLVYAPSSDLFLGSLDNKSKVCWMDPKTCQVLGVLSLGSPESDQMIANQKVQSTGKANGLADAGEPGKFFVNTAEGLVFLCDLFTSRQRLITSARPSSIHMTSSDG